jgi:DNA repair protein RecO (recombination protein O)
MPSATGIDVSAGWTDMASPLYRDTGVVLRSYKLGEADRIVVMLTEQNGKVRAVAKGVRKTTSKFGARLEPLSHVRVLLYRGRELDIVSQAESVETLAPLVADLDHLTNGLAIVEAVDQMTMEREPVPHLYRMLVGALHTVAARSGPLVVSSFYWKVLSSEGVRPELDACVRCSATEPLVAFDVVEGGVLCRACRSGVPISAPALDVMRMILGGRLNEALNMPASPITHEVASHANRALEHHLERRLRTVAMFESH